MKCVGPECYKEALAKGLCTGHYTQVRRGNPLTPLKPYAVDPNLPYKHCPVCNTTKPRDEFYIYEGRTIGTCKECRRARERAHRAREAAQA